MAISTGVVQMRTSMPSARSVPHRGVEVGHGAGYEWDAPSAAIAGVDPQLVVVEVEVDLKRA